MVANLEEEEYYELCKTVTDATKEVSKPVWEIVKVVRGINPNLATQLENGVTDLVIKTMETAFNSGLEFATVPLRSS